MIVFLVAFFLVYGSLHGYLLWKVHATFKPLGPWRLGGIILFCLLMIAGPIAVRLADKAGHGRLAGAMGLVCYTWTAVLWWFVCLALLSDAWNLGMRLVGFAWPLARQAMISPRVTVFVAIPIIALALVWGVIEANNITLQTVEIESPHLPPGTKPIRIVQLSDLHLGLCTGSGRLAPALERVREARPDILISTGDLVESPFETTRHLAEMFAEIEAPLGKFAVTGNHEYFAGMDEARKFHDAAGFALLQGRRVEVDGRLTLVGVDDPASRRFGATDPGDEAALLESADDRMTTVLLKHQPLVDKRSVGRFDLQVSGHTHGGQLWPWNYITRITYPLDAGLFDVGSGSRVYVSRGTGTWGPPLRVLAPPEVTLFIIKPPTVTARQSPQ